MTLAHLALADSADECTSPTIYRVIDLGHLGFATDTLSTDVLGTFSINNKGQVAFYKKIDGDVHGFYWLPEADYGIAAGIHDLDTAFPSTEEPHIARDINESGFIIGQVDGVSNVESEAFVWDIDNNVTYSLGFLTDGDWSRGFGINDDDPPVATGYGETGEGTPCETGVLGFKAVVDSSIDLDELYPNASQANSESYDIDDSEICAGAAYAPVGAGCNCLVACRNAEGWTGANGTPLDQTTSDIAEARAVNEASHLVGWEVGFPLSLARFWENISADAIELSDFMPDGQDSDKSRAEGINDLEDPTVVGWNVTDNHAYLWQHLGDEDFEDWCVVNLQDQHNRPILLTEAHDINDDGWIVCLGDGDGATGFQAHAYVLIPYSDSCPADLDDDGDVDFDDFTNLLANFGVCPAGGFCVADIDLDGEVDFDDFTTLLASWGSCASPGGSLLDDMIEAGLTENDYDDYMSILANGTQGQKDCYTTWVHHYLYCSPSCGGGLYGCADPFS